MLELVCIVSCVCMYLNMRELVLQLSVVDGRTYPYVYTRYCCDVMWFYVLTCVTILRVTILFYHVFTCQYIFHTSMCTFLSCDPTHNCCHLLLKRCVRSGYCISKYHSLFLPRLSQFCWTVHVLNRTKSNYMCLLSFDETCLLRPGCERYQPQPLQGPSLRRDRTFAGIDPLPGLLVGFFLV